MNSLEFSNGFDTLLNSFSDGASINLTEYEKSFFLTLAQDLYIKELYLSSDKGVSFECDEKTRRELESIVLSVSYDSSLDSREVNTLEKGKYSHIVFTLPKDCWYIVYEEVNNTETSCQGLKVADVLPVTHDNYFRVTRNPFRGPSSTRVLRLDKGLNLVELVSSFTPYIYTIRYIRQPKPIILEAMPSESSILDSIITESPCELPSELHWDILLLAVKLAISRESLYSKT